MSGGPVANAAGVGSAAVVPSEIYALDVGPEAQSARLTEMTSTIDQLRSASTGGWQAFQSDINGYAREVSGGRFPADQDPIRAVSTFMSAFGSVFGPPTDLVYESSSYDATGLATVWAAQTVGGVPVEGGSLVASVRQGGAGSEVMSVQGQLFEVTAVTATPTLTSTQAVAVTQEIFGPDVLANPSLIVSTAGSEPRLAWAITVNSASVADVGPVIVKALEFPATVLIDASNGALIGARSEARNVMSGAASTADPGTQTTSIDYGDYSFTLPPGGKPITIPITYLGTTPIEVNAEQLPDGSILLADFTGRAANRSTKKGGIVVLDAQLGDTQGGSLGAVAVYPNIESIPRDALYAMWGVRQTLDVLESRFGLESFDGDNSPVPIIINYTEPGDPCTDNAFFSTAPGASHMLIGLTCRGSATPEEKTLAVLEVMAHEIGHGITHSHTDFGYWQRAEQVALDEGSSDYVGLIVRNAVLGGDSTTLMGDACEAMQGESTFCRDWREGPGMRSSATGATLDNYIFMLDDPYRRAPEIITGDDGHDNGMVWTNALTSIRRALAAAAGEEPATSARAQAFDQAVLRANTLYFGPGTGLVEAAQAVQRAAREVGLTQAERDLIADRFRASRLCPQCNVVVGADGDAKPVSVSTSLKSNPVAVGQRVAFLYTAGGAQPVAVVSDPANGSLSLATQPRGVGNNLAAAGDRLLSVEDEYSADGRYTGVNLVETDFASGRSQIVAKRVDCCVAPAGGPDGITWMDWDGVVHYKDRSGREITQEFKDTPALLATGSGLVAVLDAKGTLYLWETSTGKVRELGGLDPFPFATFWNRDTSIMPFGAMAMSGHRLALVASAIYPGALIVLDFKEGTQTTYSTAALPLGVAISEDYLAWTEYTGEQVTPLSGSGPNAGVYLDSALRAYSFADQQYLEIVDHRGQQGYPSLSDSLLAWQESANAGTDIYSLPLPSR